VYDDLYELADMLLLFVTVRFNKFIFNTANDSHDHIINCSTSPFAELTPSSFL